MPSAQMPVGQGFAAGGEAPEQPHGSFVPVAGADGPVGRAVVCWLAAQPWASSVTAFVYRRGALTLGQVAPGRLRGRVIGFDRLDAAETQPAFAAGIVICALGTTVRQAGFRVAFRRVDVEYPIDLAWCAFVVGMHHFLLVGALGADTRLHAFYDRYKGRVEAEILAIGFPSVTAVRFSPLFGAHMELRLGERIAQALSPTTGQMVPRAWRLVLAESAATALVMTAHVDASSVRALENMTLLGAKGERPVG